MHQDGVVAEWHEKGYGFILFSNGRHAYVHHTSVSSTGPGPINLAQGELVKALVVEDEHNPGKWAALDVQRKGLIQGTTQLHMGPPQSAVPVSSSTGAASMMEGVVMEWNSRGFGFIQLQDGRRAYVHHTSIGGGNLLEGEMVSAVVMEDAKNPGKWAAVDVHRGGAVDMAQLQAMHHMPVTTVPVHQQQQQQQQQYPHHQVADHLITAASTDMSERIDCIVTEWSERGYGFLQTADCRRAYVHASAFGGGNLVKGESVNGIIVEDPQSPGKWQARSLQRGSLYEESWGQEPASYRPAEDHLDYAQPAEYRRQPADRLAEDHVDHVQPAEEGVVIEWRREGGYGFLSMDDGRRVYIHHSCFGGGDLNAGQRLSVQTKPDSRNPGKWSVAIVFSDVHGCGGSCGAAAAGGGGRGGVEPACSADAAIGAPPVKPQLPVSHNLMATPMQTPRRPNQGLIWAYVTDWDLKGFGFVLTEDGRRVYVHHSAFGSGNLSVGERVAITIVPDQINSGKLMAQALVRDATQAGLTTQGPWERRSLGPSPASPPAHRQPELAVKIDQHLEDASATLLLQEEDWMRGIVTEWHEERGYGFIELEDGRRLYIHHTAFGGGSLVQGAPCEAIPVPDRVHAGKLSAASVRGDAAVIPRALGGGDPALKRRRIS